MIVIGTDHGGLALKERIAEHLRALGVQVVDMGVHSDDSVDYPDTSERVCREFLGGGYAFGVVLCGTGIGASIAANKIYGIRCALIHDLYTAEMAKAHNNANIIALGGRVSYPVQVERLVDCFMDTEFQGGRHERRIEKLGLIDRDG